MKTCKAKVLRIVRLCAAITTLALVSQTDVSAQAPVPFICDGRFYLTQVFSQSSALVEVDIDPATQEVTFNVITNNLGTVINGIGYRSEENIIYGVNPIEHFLYQIDATGALFELTRLDLTPGFFYLGADITPDGRFLVLVGSTDVDGLPLDRHLAYVDLEDPNYSVRIVPLEGELVNMLDVAFDPTDDTFYGFDSWGNRLVIIEDDGTVVAPFDPSPLLENAGSLFFDVFGDLFAYGSPEGGAQNTLYAVDKTNGRFQVLTTGALARATDACTCPFSVEVRKYVFPEVTIPCSRVQYIFAISNLSNRAQGGVNFEDILPAGFQIRRIIKNPFGGQVQSGEGTGILQITDLTIPDGVDSLIIEVELDDLPAGEYKNQSLLTGLPRGLGEFRLSDNPNTLVKRDSTVLVIEPLDFDTLVVEESLCFGESVVVDVSQYGIEFLWEDGSTDSRIEFTQPGTYFVETRTLCDTAWVQFEVSESRITAEITADKLELALGDTVNLQTEVFSSHPVVSYQWDDPFGESLSCEECANPTALPIDDVEYAVTVTNEQGCSDIATVQLAVDTERSLYAANVFSPNGDAINDVFFLRGKGNGRITRFDIYNRWGGLVYSAPGGFVNDPSAGWDGRVGSRFAEPAVYTWVAEIAYVDNTSEIAGGDVTLLR